MNREEWLTQAAQTLLADLSGIGYATTKPIRVTCGWPSRSPLARKQRRIGECWDPAHSTDGTGEVFISPLLADPCEVLGVLTHELIHHVVGVEHGHKGPFKRAMKAIGLEGKPTATHAGPELAGRLNALANELGPYPHAEIHPARKAKTQGTRMIKLTCPECGYIVRTTRTCIKKAAPICGVCHVEFQEKNHD